MSTDEVRVPRATRLIADARTVDGRSVDVHLGDGHIVDVVPARSARPRACTVDDVQGALVLPAFVEPHAHLDKALTADQVANAEGDLPGAIRGWDVAVEQGLISADEMVPRAIAMLRTLVANGVTAVRTHVNVGAGIGSSYVRALDRARRELGNAVDVQLVALPAPPICGPAGAPNRAALESAVEDGVDLIGGCPHLEPDGPRMIREVLRLAADAGRDVDLHVDETLDASMLTLQELARAVMDLGFEGSVTASHCVSLGMQSPAVQRAVAGEVAAARIAVVTLPATNLFLQGRDHPVATPRGLTAVRTLLDAGVVVAAGGDNVQDPFNPVGRGDPLETAALAVMAGHVSPDEACSMVSDRARSVVGLPRVEIVAGAPADLVVVEASSVRAAVAGAPAARRVYRAGRLTAVTTVSTTLVRPDE